MKKHAIVAGLLALPAAVAWGEPDFYGRANVSFELVDEGGDTDTALESNASRVGVEGSERLNDAYQVIYQLEYEVDIDGDEDTFSQRDTFIGLKSYWGAVVAGRINTPFKQAQGKVDLFNDLRGDIKRITPNERREPNSVIYSTPESFGPLSADVAYISSEDEERDNGISTAVAYEADGLYAAVALDQDVVQEDAEAARFVTTYAFDAWRLGALFELTDPAFGDSETAWLLSGLYELDKWAFKAQGGSGYRYNDLGRLEDADTLSLGADYRLAKNLKAFTFYTTTDYEGSDANHYLGAGMELRF